MMDTYTEFHEEIERLEKEVDYYKDRYELVCEINTRQMETINTYAKIVKLQEVELDKLRYGE